MQIGGLSAALLVLTFAVVFAFFVPAGPSLVAFSPLWAYEDACSRHFNEDE